MILAGRTDDLRAECRQKTVQLIDVGALAGAEAEMMQTDTVLLECRAFMLGRRRADADRGAATDAVIVVSVSITGFSPRNGSSSR